MKIRGRTVGEKRIKGSILKLLNLKILYRHPSGDVEQGVRHTRLEPREKERV